MHCTNSAARTAAAARIAAGKKNHKVNVKFKQI